MTKYIGEAINSFLNNLAMEGVDCPVAIILTPEAFTRVCVEDGMVGVKVFEFAHGSGNVVIQAGVVERVGG